MHRPKRFKIARRLGPAVFEQTQTERFALSEARKKKGQAKDKHRKNISAYNLALRDKQRVRFYYGINERQFARYVKESSAKTGDPAAILFATLERRLDNVVFRASLAPTHRAARQMVSHGHITVNGKKIRVASHIVHEGDLIAIRAGSINKKPFVKDGEKKEIAPVLPDWISFDDTKSAWKIAGMPKSTDMQGAFNFTSIVEFYSR
jgi:small subunit ribosomal protein S4